MTVIAWRNNIMACDSCWSSNGTQTVSLVKIKRLSSGALLGSAGDNDCRALIEMLDKVKDAKHLPSRADLANTRLDYAGLLALPKGDVWYIATGKHDDAGYPADDDEDYGIWPATTMGGYAAVGSGADCALSAMDANASAKEAVAIAIRRNVYCRGPVHSMRLNPPPKKS